MIIYSPGRITRCFLRATVGVAIETVVQLLTKTTSEYPLKSLVLLWLLLQLTLGKLLYGINSSGYFAPLDKRCYGFICSELLGPTRRKCGTAGFATRAGERGSPHVLEEAAGGCASSPGFAYRSSTLLNQNSAKRALSLRATTAIDRLPQNS